MSQKALLSSLKRKIVAGAYKHVRGLDERHVEGVVLVLVRLLWVGVFWVRAADCVPNAVGVRALSLAGREQP